MSWNPTSIRFVDCCWACFFITVGASIDFELLSVNLVETLSLTAGLIALKVAVLFVLAVKFKLQGADRWLFSLGLAQAGEFGFVLLSYTVGLAVIPQTLADQLLLVVALSMLLTPLLFLLFDRVIAPRYSKQGEKERRHNRRETQSHHCRSWKNRWHYQSYAAT